MLKYNIPTAAYQVFTKDKIEECLLYLDEIKYPTVIKASGLAAGKGVAICESKILLKNILNNVLIIQFW